MYSNKIKINKNFQTSINLELDLNNEKKIQEYIPTSDICDVLKRYIKAASSSDGGKATTLVGPYGKGKSFLLLVLSYLISQDPKSQTYKSLCRKIKKIDPELSEMIHSLNSSKTKLLPIIINSNYDNLNQAFMLALNEALKRESITNIIPETAYSVCLTLINEWNSDNEHIAKVLAKCEKELKTPLRKIEMGLKNYSAESYNQFVTLYNCVTHGMPFNPLVNNDIVHIYSEVNHELIKRGYSGMFIIFDEFSKFLESSGDSLSKNLKIIQDYAELASRSSVDEQLHICCVTHKSLALYKTSDKIDSFKTVEGRFKEVKFNRSLDENYQIISAAINNIGAQEIAKQFVESNSHFYSELSLFEPFRKDVDLNDLFYGCFPLNPMTVYSLIQLSELVAQNERTLFTFISDTDDNSFNSFIHSNSSGLFNVDKIYDYFGPLMKREEGNDIRNIWYRSEGTLSRVTDQESRKIIKAIAVILMINDMDNYPASEEMISLSTMIPKDVVASKINDLIEQHYLRKNILNNLLSFTTSNNKEIEDKISIIAQSKILSISFDTVLDDINESRYLLPRRYNEQNKITRFYKVSFITEEQLQNLNSFEIYRERGFSDGLVLNLIRQEMSEKDIVNRFLEFNDNRVILRYPTHPVNPLLFEELIRHVALQEILYKGGNDPVLTNEIDLLLQETDEDIKELIAIGFESDYKCVSSLVSDYTDFNDLLSKQMDLVFTKRLVFNNELINKNTVSAVYQKAANNVIEDLINKRETEYSPTSPETTIKKSVVDKMDQIDAKEVISEIKSRIIHAETEKLRISMLVDKYTNAPYGIRLGIMTMIISKCINELSDNILLYLKDKEIDLTAGNLVKAVNTDGEYYLRSSKGTMAQANYMVDVLNTFGKIPTGNFRIDTKTVCDEYRKFFMGLPMIMRNLNEDNTMGIPTHVIKYKKFFMSYSLNAYEVVFEQPLKICDSENYNQFKREIIPFIKSWSKYLQAFKESLAQEIKDNLEIPRTTSLHMGLNALVKKYTADSTPVLSESGSAILSSIQSLSFNDSEALNQVCGTVLGVYVEDWSKDMTDIMLSRILEFFDELSSSKRINASTSTIDRLLEEIDYKEQSYMGELFKNSLESVMDEFGESVSTEEKIAIITTLLKKYL